jgi:hypothetical protein
LGDADVLESAGGGHRCGELDHSAGQVDGDYASRRVDLRRGFEEDGATAGADVQHSLARLQLRVRDEITRGRREEVDADLVIGIRAAIEHALDAALDRRRVVLPARHAMIVALRALTSTDGLGSSVHSGDLRPQADQFGRNCRPPVLLSSV